MNHECTIPLDVPKAHHTTFAQNYYAITQNSNRLLLLTGDQKMEHLNANFYGPDIHPDVSKPTHLFEIARQANVGAFAAHLGLIARYAQQYSSINYLVKLNGKTNIMPTTHHDPYSKQLWTVHDVMAFKHETGLAIRGIGYTVYLGSRYEADMLQQAAQAVFQAHQHGLVAVLWMYPRGAAVPNERTPELIAGAAGVAATLGADFVKINPPHAQTIQQEALLLQQAVTAAGSTRVVCAGGKKISDQDFFEQTEMQLTIAGTAGCAIGRNIYQRSLPEAIAYAKAIRALIIEKKSSNEALLLLNKKG